MTEPPGREGRKGRGGEGGGEGRGENGLMYIHVFWADTLNAYLFTENNWLLLQQRTCAPVPFYNTASQ